MVIESGGARGSAREQSSESSEQAPGSDKKAEATAFRERIVQASTELIEEQGLAALSMREVARRAGVSHQAPYYYFADREAIIGAIAEQGFRMMREYVQRSAPEAGAAPHEAIMAAGRAYLEFALAHRAHFRVMFRPELVTAERHPNVRGEGIHACDTFYRIVQSAVEAGLPADPSVDALFLLCWSVVHGLACLVLDGPLDVVMPNADRQAQLRDVLATFARLTEASVRSAQQATDTSRTPPGKAIRKRASKASSSRTVTQRKKNSGDNDR